MNNKATSTNNCEPSAEAYNNICCSCLASDRKLLRLCDSSDGLRNLFFLLSRDSEAYEELYNKVAANVLVCWECKALMRRLCKFRDDACAAQKQLYNILKGRTRVV